MKYFNLLVFFLITFFSASAQKHYTLDQIPNPKIAGQDYFVSNPDGILNNVESINSLLIDLERQTKIEFTVVVVNNFKEDQDDFEFTINLFNKWGIGKAGSNNGLLLFIAKDRRKYRFISGTGVEGLLPDVVLEQIGKRNLVPAFREGKYDEGIINAVNEINDKLTNPNNIAEIQGLISQEKKKSIDWQYPIGGSSLVILLFVFVFKLLNKQEKNSKLVRIEQPKVLKNKAKKKLRSNKAIQLNNTNGYDAVYTKGCAGIFFFVFFSVLILGFSGGFGLFENFKINYIPYIFYTFLAIGLFFRYYYYIANLRRTHFDDKNFFEAVKAFHIKNWWLIIFSPLIIISLIIHAVKKTKTIDRFKPILGSKNQEMFRLDRDLNLEGEPYLTKGQRKEELIKAYDYDIWESEDKTEHIIKAWPAEEYNSFIECPACTFRTYELNKQLITKSPTYSSSGEAKVVNTCSFCMHEEFIRWISLAMLVKSNSSSSSSGGSSGSSSSSSGSFGGGSSSGGGSGGSW